jgi:glycine/D-amino acid oxidase-like deaminating enzyme
MTDTPLPSHADLPAHASIVVIGGGVMGCSTLYHLAREGVEVEIARRMSPGRVTLQPAFDPGGNRMRKAKGAQP